MKEYFAKLKYLFKWRDVLFAVFLISITVLFAFCSARNMMEVTFGETAVDIVTKRYTMNVPYDLVESVEIGDVNPDDELIQGKGDLALRTGLCKNAEWGEYYGCIDLQTGKCVLIHLKDGRLFVFSHQSDEKVQSDYETLLSHLNP